MVVEPWGPMRAMPPVGREFWKCPTSKWWNPVKAQPFLSSSPLSHPVVEP